MPIMSPQDEQWRRTSYSVCILQFSWFTEDNRMQSKHKQTNFVTIADETLTDYSFLSRYHYTKSKNYLKRRYRIRHWIPMFIGTPCMIIDQVSIIFESFGLLKYLTKVNFIFLAYVKTQSSLRNLFYLLVWFWRNDKR